MIEGFKREGIYLWFYFSVLMEQIAPYWIIGMLMGSAISVFFKERMLKIFLRMQTAKSSIATIVAASFLGIVSPLCMYGTIPVAAAFSKKGVPDHVLAAFMMSSILLNPQLMIYSAALGREMLMLRFIASALIGIMAGCLLRFSRHQKAVFDFTSFDGPVNRDLSSNLWIRFGKNLGRNIKATGPYFLVGIGLTAAFQRYVPQESFSGLFVRNEGLGVLYAATLGVPVYVCGGGTIPLLMEWLQRGLSTGAAVAFMITGPATKFTNLGAVKMVLGKKNFARYIVYTILLAWIFGFISNLVTINR